MYRRPRIIPSLLLQEGGLVKTQKFDKPRYLGAPVNAVKIFNNKGVDELCILDISAPRTGGEPDYDLLHDIRPGRDAGPHSGGGGLRGQPEHRGFHRCEDRRAGPLLLLYPGRAGENSLLSSPACPKGPGAGNWGDPVGFHQPGWADEGL